MGRNDMVDYGKNFENAQNWPNEFEESVKDEAPEKMGKIVSSTGLVNLRRDPSTKNDPITTLKHDEEVMILSEAGNEWYKIMAQNGAEGFVMKKLVELI